MNGDPTQKHKSLIKELKERNKFLERYTDEQGQIIVKLEWEIHQLKEALHVEAT